MNGNRRHQPEEKGGEGTRAYLSVESAHVGRKIAGDPASDEVGITPMDVLHLVSAVMSC